MDLKIATKTTTKNLNNNEWYFILYLNLKNCSHLFTLCIAHKITRARIIIIPVASPAVFQLNYFAWLEIRWTALTIEHSVQSVNELASEELMLPYFYFIYCISVHIYIFFITLYFIFNTISPWLSHFVPVLYVRSGDIRIIYHCMIYNPIKCTK